MVKYMAQLCFQLYMKEKYFMPDNKYADNRLKLARTSLMKARQDLTVLEKLVNDEEVVDEIIGFHAQQVVEKSIKAVLT